MREIKFLPKLSNNYHSYSYYTKNEDNESVSIFLSKLIPHTATTSWFSTTLRYLGKHCPLQYCAIWANTVHYSTVLFGQTLSTTVLCYLGRHCPLQHCAIWADTVHYSTALFGQTPLQHCAIWADTVHYSTVLFGQTLSTTALRYLGRLHYSTVLFGQTLSTTTLCFLGRHCPPQHFAIDVNQTGSCCLMAA